MSLYFYFAVLDVIVIPGIFPFFAFFLPASFFFQRVHIAQCNLAIKDNGLAERLFKSLLL